ncbi:hypothetical protein L3X38_004079 [Prunus dulcis]|uniref:Reverse transcriptase Ty1/copia-type domain-containing protein n=1 Tax=Prunus dulcis TaxID=3755 RepID=A0AAD4ZN81_PRUDU|nr:hypothetical protein L3X38_004079 [Prunus dulcis]
MGPIERSKPIEPGYRIIGAISARLSNDNQIQIRAYSHAQDDKGNNLELYGPPPTAGIAWLIYTMKLKADGSIERYKVRIMAKGYKPRYRMGYLENFATIAKIDTIRVLLSLATNLDWPLHQFNVKNAFLHRDLVEEIYMDLPLGCNLATEKKNQVCKCIKSLYGLKQSPNAWFSRFTKSMKNFGYTQSNSDDTVFLKCDEGNITALVVCVDDIVVTGNDTREQHKLQKYLSQ